MKVIDLLNMIAKGEKIPEKIKCNYITFEWDKDKNMYYRQDAEHVYISFVPCELNDEVEIIEESKEIEHQDMFDFFTGYDFKGTNKELLQHLETNFTIINKELSELVDEVNKLKSND